MKKIIIFIGLILFTLIFIPAAFTQTDSGFRGQSMNGATGLFSIPSGRIGWDGQSKMGLDIGYRAVFNSGEGTAHIPAITFSMANLIELSAAFDLQPEVNNRENNDLLLGFKIKMSGNRDTSVVLGGNVQLLNLGNNSYTAYQPFIAVTFSGSFFSMNADTTLVVGKTFFYRRQGKQQ